MAGSPNAAPEQLFGQLNLNQGLGIHPGAMSGVQYGPGQVHTSHPQQRVGNQQQGPVPEILVFRLDKKNPNDKNATWAIADRKIVSLSREQIKQNVDRTNAAASTKNFSKFVPFFQVEGLKKRQLEQLIQDLQFIKPVPKDMEWFPIGIELIAKDSKGKNVSSKNKAIVVVMKMQPTPIENGTRRVYRRTRLLAFPLEAHVDVTDKHEETQKAKYAAGEPINDYPVLNNLRGPMSYQQFLPITPSSPLGYNIAQGYSNWPAPGHRGVFYSNPSPIVPIRGPDVRGKPKSGAKVVLKKNEDHSSPMSSPTTIETDSSDTVFTDDTPGTVFTVSDDDAKQRSRRGSKRYSHVRRASSPPRPVLHNETTAREHRRKNPQDWGSSRSGEPKRDARRHRSRSSHRHNDKTDRDHHRHRSPSPSKRHRRERRRRRSSSTSSSSSRSSSASSSSPCRSPDRRHKHRSRRQHDYTAARKAAWRLSDVLRFRPPITLPFAPSPPSPTVRLPAIIHQEDRVRASYEDEHERERRRIAERERRDDEEHARALARHDAKMENEAEKRRLRRERLERERYRDG